jgi:hypothetical protein
VSNGTWQTLMELSMYASNVPSMTDHVRSILKHTPHDLWLFDGRQSSGEHDLVIRATEPSHGLFAFEKVQKKFGIYETACNSS